MPLIPETYYIRRIRESHDAMLNAKDSGSRIAHAQLEAAYRVLAGAAEYLPVTPIYQHGSVVAHASGSAPLACANDVADVKMLG